MSHGWYMNTLCCMCECVVSVAVSACEWVISACEWVVISFTQHKHKRAICDMALLRTRSFTVNESVSACEFFWGVMWMSRLYCICEWVVSMNVSCCMCKRVVFACEWVLSVAVSVVMWISNPCLWMSRLCCHLCLWICPVSACEWVISVAIYVVMWTSRLCLCLCL